MSGLPEVEMGSPVDFARFWYSTVERLVMAEAILYLDRVLADIARDGGSQGRRAQSARNRIRRSDPWTPNRRSGRSATGIDRAPG